MTGVRKSEPLEVIRAEAARQGSPLFEALAEVRAEARETEQGQRVSLQTPEDVHRDVFLPLAGAHQVENLALAIRAAEVARRVVDLPIPREAMVSGVGATVWEARLERWPGRPSLLIDSAHNPDGAAALARYLQDHPHPGRVLLFGAMKDKKIAAMAEFLFPCAEAIVVTRPPNRRAEDPEGMLRWALERGFPAEAGAGPRTRARAGGRSGPGGGGGLDLSGRRGQAAARGGRRGLAGCF